MLSRALTRIVSRQNSRRHLHSTSIESSFDTHRNTILFKNRTVPSSLSLTNSTSTSIFDKYGGNNREIPCLSQLQRKATFSSQGGGGGGMASPPWVNPDNQVIGEAIAQYSVDLTEMAKDGKLDPVIGRHEEIRRTLQILARRTKNNPVLIGEPGMCLKNVTCLMLNAKVLSSSHMP